LSSPPAAAAQHGSGDIKGLVPGLLGRALRFNSSETYGLGNAGAYLDAAAAGPVLDRSLHAAGQLCPRCRRPFAEQDPVRRLNTGELVHDFC
jgi:hypothetical protein